MGAVMGGVSNSW